MSSIDTERFRELLLDRRKHVAAAIAHLHAEHPDTLEDEAGDESYDEHLSDIASATFDRELGYTLEENSEHVLSSIDEALRRIDDGTFGKCRTCGNPIGEERLEAIPYATQCIDCKRREERG